MRLRQWSGAARYDKGLEAYCKASELSRMLMRVEMIPFRTDPFAVSKPMWEAAWIGHRAG